MELALTTRPARRVEGEIRAPATLVDATFHAIADAGSIPAVSTDEGSGSLASAIACTGPARRGTAATLTLVCHSHEAVA